MREEARRGLVRCLESGEMQALEHPLPGGRWALSRATPLLMAGRIDKLMVSVQDITLRRKSEEALARSLRELEARGREIEDKNTALRQLLAAVEAEKEDLRRNLAANLEKTVLPLLDKLRLHGAPARYTELLRTRLLALAGGFGVKLSGAREQLSPRETEIAALIRDGLATKEIAALLKVSPMTVHNQRKTIRRKLGLSGKDINLISFLRNLQK